MILSICVPVFGTQCFFQALLESIKEAIKTCINNIDSFTLDGASRVSLSPLISLFGQCKEKIGSYIFELIVVDDGSEIKSDKKLLYKICKEYKKEFESSYFTKLTLIEHSKNLGLLEARRSAVMESSGKWIMFVDSDDELPSNAILHLLCNAEIYNASIVQGKGKVVKDADDDTLFLQGYKKDKIEALEKKVQKVHVGFMNRGKTNDIMRSFLIKESHNGFLWGKIFLADVCKKAFMEIPQSFCVMGEDFLIYFFILLHASSYLGIEEEVYKYYLGRGISNNAEIKDLRRWEAAITAGAVFTIIFDYLEEHPMQDDIVDAIMNIASFHVLSNVKHFRRVAPEIKDEAYALMKSYWSCNMIEDAESYYKNNL